MKPEELLAHGDFVRRLARRLVLDEHRAADVAQQTWLAALEHPPGSDRPLRAWLGRVARNFAYRLRRSEARIEARERAAARPERMMPTEKVVAREENRRRVVQAVLDLPEPYRSTLLFRYYEDLPPREVAARMEVPVETVRTRLKRGLEQMRLRLDAMHGGGRDQWLSVLAPLAGLKITMTSVKAAAPASTAGVTGGLTTLASGAAIMSVKLKFTAALLFVIGVAACFVYFLNPGDDAKHLPHELRAVDSTGQGIDDEKTVKPDAEQAVSIESTAMQEEVKAAVTPEGSFLSGKVVDRETGEPVTSFHVDLSSKDEGGDRKYAVQEPLEDQAGRFDFPLEQGGTFRLRVMASCYDSWDQTNLEVPPGEGLSGLLVELDPGYSVTGRVVDDATGKPVPGALVGPASMPNEASLVYRLVGSSHHSRFTSTDGKGCFLLHGLRKYGHSYTDGKWRIAAAHPDYAEGLVLVPPFTKEEVEIRLKRGYRIHGKALDDRGAPCRGLMIAMAGDDNPMPRPVLTRVDGSYRTPPTLPGVVFLRAGPPPGVEGARIEFTEETKRVVVKDQDMEVNFGWTADHVTWQGTFYDAAGYPITDGTIELYPVGVKFWDSIMYNVEREMKTDQEGKFRIGKLLPGDYNMKFRYRKMSVHLDGGVISFPRPGLVERDLYVQGAMVRGAVVYHETDAPVLGKTGKITASRSLPNFKMYSVPIDPEGRFNLEGMEPGHYNIGAHVDGYSHVWGPEAEIDENEVIRDYCIRIRPGGTFILRLTGFEDLENRNFKYLIAHVDREWHSYDWEPMDPSGTWTYEREFVTGPGTVKVEFENGLMAERPYEVVEGKTTEVVIRRDELFAFEGTVAVAGTMIHADGSPVAGARLHFFRLDRFDLGPEELSRQGRTDPEGRFSVPGFKPGRWKVSGYPPGGGEACFSELLIPPKPSDPFPLDLVLPAGSITGRLFDKETGLPMKSDDPWWSVRLFEKTTKDEVSGDRSSPSGDERFTLIGVPEGTFELRVFSLGYQEYLRENIRFTEGQRLDLGAIHLEPGPLLELEVVDREGKPVTPFELFFEGKHIWDSMGVDRSPGKKLYYAFPPGPASIRIAAKGFKEKEAEIDLIAGETLKLRLELVAE